MKKNKIEIEVLPDEYWWGGLVQDGISMPYCDLDFERDLNVNLLANQGNPVLLSSKGRYVWSEEPYAYSFSSGNMIVESLTHSLVFGEGYNQLRDVYRHVSENYFPPTGGIPDPLLFTAPQYNTWIEMTYEPTQEKVIAYAERILANGMPPGVIMIDDNWQEDYGNWVFHPGRFPDPKKMVDKLHQMGFKVMLWICNYVSADSMTFRLLQEKGYLIKEADGNPAIRHWWNGYSSVLDSTNEKAVDWLCDQLDKLMGNIGVDGFKFDAGDPEGFREGDRIHIPTHPNGHCEAWARIGLRYPLNEYRACWKLAGQPLVQRLCDKNHSWDAYNGLQSLIPNGLAQGLLGYSYICPDMIGGGNFTEFIRPISELDQELIVRSAQCSALFPMMQFSVAPWRVLDDQHLQYCVDAANLHAEFGNTIVSLAEQASISGEPILRHMSYVFPTCGYERITDQFMLGDEILVAPVVEKGAVNRKVVLPQGTWIGDDGSEIEGPCTAVIDAPLSRLPWYHKVK